ncbi:hypothetical protein [Schaalia sp. 19OD2882]|nr:hypothetical protein [Schaalia sp. 19OD2882]
MKNVTTKILALAVAGGLAFSLSACGNTGGGSTQSGSTSTTQSGS